MKARHWVLLVVLTLFGSCTFVFLGGLRTEHYHGRVVDRETGAPLAGAAVTVIWSKAPLVSIHGGVKTFHNADETATDDEGRFSIRTSPGLDWNPMTGRVEEPLIVIYQPGYEPLTLYTMLHAGFDTQEALAEALKSGATIGLRRLRADEALEYTDVGLRPIDTPPERIRILIEAINIQRKNAGLEPFTF